MSNLNNLKKDLQKLANPQQAQILQRFFKTGPGEYGEGDVFLGINVPDQRKVAKKYVGISLDALKKLVNSKIHEHRLTGFMLLDYKYQQADQRAKKKLFNFYIKNRAGANNWDIIDVTAPKIIGDFLIDKDKSILYKFAKSKNLWERRIAMVACIAFIRENDFKDTLRISEILLNDEHDLIHKAVGWMLREVGKRDQAVGEKFLKKHYQKMPRTMLRYAIERFSDKKRRLYLKK